MALSNKLTYKIKVYMAESLVCKIPRKFVQTAFILLGTALIYWIHCKSSAEIKKNPINWDYVIKVSLQPFPTPCKSNTFMVIIVTSYVANEEIRMAHRIVTPEEELRKINTTRVFLLAQIPDTEKRVIQSAINEESDNFGDILQGNFIENYKNLTYKHLMGLKWASTTCRGASFILKLDDDTVYNLTRTYSMLNSISKSLNTTDLLMGYMHYNAKPIRVKNRYRKWYVSFDEYPRYNYPPYVAGWYYITTPRVAAALCDEAIHHPYFWIDDIFVTGILAEALGIVLTYKPSEYSLDNFINCHCCFVGFRQRKKFICKNKVIQ